MLVNFPRGRTVMSRLLTPLLRFLRREDGPTAVEYALVLALIVVVCIVAISALGTGVTKPFKKYSKFPPAAFPLFAFASFRRGDCVAVGVTRPGSPHRVRARLARLRELPSNAAPADRSPAHRGTG